MLAAYLGALASLSWIRFRDETAEWSTTRLELFPFDGCNVTTGSLAAREPCKSSPAIADSRLQRRQCSVNGSLPSQLSHALAFMVAAIPEYHIIPSPFLTAVARLS